MKRLIALCFALLLGGCAGDNDGPARVYVVVDHTPATMGAMIITISGGPVSGMASPAGEFTQYTDARGTHVLMAGPLAEGELFSFDIPDASTARAYVATVDQVADGTTYALLDPGVVRLRLVAPE